MVSGNSKQPTDNGQQTTVIELQNPAKRFPTIHYRLLLTDFRLLSRNGVQFLAANAGFFGDATSNQESIVFGAGAL